MDINLLFTFCLCLLLSGFFSASETALTALSHAKTRQLLEGTHRLSALHLWLKKPNLVLTTILVCNNLVNTLGAVVATVFAQKLFNSYMLIGVTTGIVTLALLLIGEITPKIFAKHNAERVAPFSMNILLPMYFLTSPIVYILSWCASLLVKLAGGNTSPKHPIATQEDIDFLIRLGHKEGVLRGKEGKMLDSVVQFRDTLVRDAMVPRSHMHCLEKGAKLQMVIQAIQQNAHSRCPIYEKDLNHIIGVFYAKDLIRVLAQNNNSFSLGNYIRPALFVSEKMKMGSLLREFQQGKAHLAIVVNESGATTGIISLQDVLQEIVGHIHDDYDKNRSGRRKKA
ncbi:MAG: hemolysin family protein [Myxococcota bacterium]